MGDATTTETAALSPAARAIGDGAGDDYLLTPQEHAAKLPAEAAPLARVLRRAQVSNIIAEFVAADAKALAAQASYRKFGSLAIFALAAPAALGALLVLKSLAPNLSAAGDDVLRLLTLALQFVAVAVALACGLYLSRARPFDGWMTARGAAEQQRQDLFEEVIASQEPNGPGELPYLPLALEYFRRYQLEVQRAYYTVRSREALKRSGRLRGASSLTWVLLAISGAPLIAFAHSALTGQPRLFGEGIETLLIAAGAVGGGVASMLSSLSLLHLDRRNASKYEVARKNLNHLAKEPLDKARRAAAAGDRRPVLFFVEEAHRVISSEHREWVEVWNRRRRLEDEIFKLPEIE